jgi:hypothetical protein
MGHPVLYRTINVAFSLSEAGETVMANRTGTACIVALSDACRLYRWSLCSQTAQTVAPSSSQILAHFITATTYIYIFTYLYIYIFIYLHIDIFTYLKVGLNRVMRIFVPRKDEVTG